MNNKIYISFFLFLQFLLFSSPVIAQIELQPEGYFEAPGFAFLVYHNDYIVGKRGGLQMFLHGKRVLDAGEVVCITREGRFLNFDSSKMSTRSANLEKSLSSIKGRLDPAGLSYDLTCTTDGTSLHIAVHAEKPIDWSRISNLMFKIEIYPREFQYKTYRGGGFEGYFPERYMGKMMLIPAAKEIFIAPEDNLRAFSISSEDAMLTLIDGRGSGNINGFILSAQPPPGSSSQSFSMKITPRIQTAWRKAPVIQASQVGYHPGQKKVAVLELDNRVKEADEAKLFALDASGEKKLVTSGKPVRWGSLFDNEYYLFDFSDIRNPGLYYLSYREEITGPFPIRTDVYGESWHPTLDVFFPVQMCHVEVREGEKVWHGACHLDDGLAEECLKTAVDTWEFEQTHEPVHFKVSYQPQEDEYHSWELTAAAELFLTTSDEKYKNRILALIPHIKKMPPLPFWQNSGATLLRSMDKMAGEEFSAALKQKSMELKAFMDEEFSRSPYGIYFDFRVWGNNWDVLDLGGRAFYFVKHFPEIFEEEILYSSLNYNFGCHPASNHSYVSGVGVNSATVGYGFNRSEWTYIPGGVVSGASFIRPKFIEYRSNAWDWYETEYVIWGSAAYIFDVLAADYLLNRK